MTGLIDIIQSQDSAIRDRSLEEWCAGQSLPELLAGAQELEGFRRSSSNLYERVRALFFLYALHRFHIPAHPEVKQGGLIPFRWIRASAATAI